MSRRAIRIVLERERETGRRLTSYDVHVRLDEDCDISLAQCCAALSDMARAGHIQRSKIKVRRRHRSPGAYTYSLPEKSNGQQ